MKRSFWTIGALAILVAHPAFAQVVPVQPQPAAKPPTSGAPAPKAPVAPAPAGDATAAGPGASSASASTLPTGPQTLPAEDQLDDPMLRAIEEPPHVLSDWREALEHVRNRSTNYLIALSQVEAARGQSQMALANSLPKLDANAGISHQLLPGRAPNPFVGGETSQPYPNPRWQAGLSLSIPVVSARNWYDYATSKAQIEQRSIQAEDAQRLIIGGLAEAMVTVITAERLGEVTRVNLSAALSTLRLNERRATLGAGSSIDVLRAKQEVERSRAQVVEADETVRKSREALGTALGYSDAWGLPKNIRLDQLRQDARDTCRGSTDVKDRADVRASAAGAAIAQRNVKAVGYSFLPTIDAQSSLDYFPNELQSANRKHVSWTIGASLTWHLYDGGRRYGEKALNSALYEQSRQQSIQVERDATLQVRQSVRGVSVAKQSLDVAFASQEIAEANADLARAKFLNGTGSSFDLVDTQRAARQTKLDVTVKEFELLRAEIIAYLALASCEI